MSERKRIILIDSDSLARDVVRTAIQVFGVNTQEIVGEAGSVRETIPLMRQLQSQESLPDVAIVANKMHRHGGGENAAKIIRHISPKTKIVSTSVFEDSEAQFGDANLPKSISIGGMVECVDNI